MLYSSYMTTITEDMARFVIEQREAHLSILGMTDIHTNEFGVTFGTFTQADGTKVTVVDSASSPSKYMCNYSTDGMARYGVDLVEARREEEPLTSYEGYVRFHALGRCSFVCVRISS